MFEKIVERILNPILSEYVEDFNAENMKIGLWSGEVVIKNVALRKEIIKKLNLPFRLKYSRLGTLKMTIPWKSLGSSKIDVVIEGLQLIITEVPQNEWECKNHKIIDQRKKEVTSYCESIVNDFAKKTEKAGKEDEEQGYFGAMVTRIIDNLQVTIKDIHIRYEDEITKKYSFGVTLEELKIYTVNKKGEPEFIDRSKKEYENEPLRKKLHLSNFGAYWNETSEFFNEADANQLMTTSIARANKAETGNNKMNYVILMSSEAELYQREAGKQYVEPEINLIINFEELKVKISNEQLQQIITLSERLQSYVNEVKAQNRKKLTQEEMIKNYNEFTKIFPTLYEKKISPADQNTLDNILEKMEVENFKEGMKSYLQEKQKEKMVQDKLSKNKGWFSFSKPKELSEDEMKDIENFMKDNFGSEISIIKRPEDFFYIKVNFHLKLLNIAVATTNSTKQVEEGINLNLIQIGMEFNLREGGYRLDFGMENIMVNLYDKELNKAEFKSVNNILQKMPQEGCSRKIEEYINLRVVGNPLDKKHLDTEIVLKTEEILIEFDPNLVKVATNFAKIKISEKNTEAAFEAYGDMKNKVANAANEVAESLTTEKKKNFISLDVKLSSINVLLYFDPLNVLGDVWVLNLGETEIFSDPETLKKPEFTEEEAMEKYCMKTSKIGMAHYENKNKFFKTKVEQLLVNTEDKVISELSAEFEIEMFKSATEKIPKIRAKSVIHTLDLNLSNSTYPALQKIGKCFSLPPEIEVEAKKEIQKEKANEKSEVMKGSKKIGIVYEQSKDPIKYIAVLSGSYLYLYLDKKDVQYKNYFYIKNSNYETVGEKEPTKKPLSLVVENSVNKFILGFDKESTLNEWMTVFKQIDEEEDAFLLASAVTKPEEKKAAKKTLSVDQNNLNFEVCAELKSISITSILSDKESVSIEIKSLTANAKLHEAKTLAKISLKSIEIADNIYNYKYKELSKFLYSTAIEGKEKLIEINFEQISEKHTDYSLVDANISVDVGGLVCNYKPETVKSLMIFFIPKPEPLPPLSRISLESRGSSTEISIDDSLSPEEIKKRKVEKVRNEIAQGIKEKYMIKLKLSVEEIAISLVNRKTRTMIARVGLNGFTVDFGQSNRKMSIGGGIRELWLADYSNYPTTIIEEQSSYETFHYIVESYNKKREMITYNVEILEVPNEQNKTMLIKAKLNDLRVSFIQQPVLRLITYLTEQLLPSLTPDSNDSSNSKPVVINDSKPEDSPMSIIIDLENILAVVQPRIKEEEFLELLIKNISVRNNVFQRPFIKNAENDTERVLVENYYIEVNGISIIAKYKGKESKLTNDLSIALSCDLIQNSAYYRKTYSERYESGMRLSCNLTPFLMRINHDDYNFMMKCLNYNVTFDDNAEGYLFDGALKQQQHEDEKNKQKISTKIIQEPASEPMYLNLSMDRIILCVTEKELPLSVLLLSQLELGLSMGNFGMKMTFLMRNLFGINICQSGTENESIEKGMFNLFGYERKLVTSDLYEMDKLIEIYSADKIKQATLNISEKPVIDLVLELAKSGNTSINMTIQGLKINVELKSLLTLSQLAIMEPSIQPPKSSLKPIILKKEEPTPKTSAGKTEIKLELTDFFGCLSDKSGKNYVVMEGEFFVDLNMIGGQSEDEIIALGKSKGGQGKFLDMAGHTISIKNFSFYFCNVSDLKNKRYLLLPINLSLEYGQNYATAEDIVCLESEINGKLEKIIVECSVRDLLLLSKIGQDNLEVMNEYNKNLEENKKKETSGDKLEVAEIKKQDQVVDQKVVQKNKEQINKKIQNKIKANVLIEPMQIKVVNDCNNNFMPVINFIIQETKALFSGDAIKNHLTTSLTIKLDFFNPRSANWEPIIETFNLSFDFLGLISEFGSKNKIIIANSEIEEMKELKINFSTQLVTTLLATIDVAKREQKQIEKIQNLDEIEVSPYIIENKTNSIIFIERSTKTAELPPLFKGPIKLDDKAEELNFVYKDKKYSVSLEQFGLIRVGHLDEIYLDFRMEKLNRVICFVATCLIKNETIKAFTCYRFDKNKTPLEESLVLEPGESVPILKDGFLKLSLSSNSFTSLKNVDELHESDFWIAENGKFKLVVQKTKTIRPHSVFVIRSPFVVMNCLPKELQMKFIVNGKEVSKQAKIIPSQGLHEGFANTDVLALKCKIMCEGFYWSNEFGAETETIGKEERLSLKDREKGETHIKYIFEKDEIKKQYRLNIFCPAFIVSELDFDVDIYANFEKDEVNEAIERYEKLGGQNEFWRKDVENENKSIDKVTLVDADSGSKIRVCGKNCLPDFSEPVAVKNLGVNQTRIVVDKEINGKIVSLFTILGVEVELKKMALRADVVSRQITLRSRWIFFNNSEHNLSIKEQGGDKFYYNINKNEKKPFYFIVPDLKEKPKGLIFKTENTGESISIQANGLGAIFFRLQKLDTQEYLYFKLNIQEIQSYLYYDITEVTYEHLPYQIIVKSDKLEAEAPLFNAILNTTNPPVQFINELPHQPYNLQLLVRLKGSKNSQDITVEADNLNYKEKINLFEEGVNDMFVIAVIYVIFNDSRKYIVIDELHKEEEELPEYETQTINFKLEKLSLSIIQNSSSSTTSKSMESFYFYMSNLEFIMDQTNKRTKYQTKLQFLQFDQDEPYNIPNPVIITPCKYKQFTSTDPKDKPKSIFNSLIEIDNSFVKNMFINQIAIDINDLVIRVGTAFIKLILQIIKEYTDAAKAEEEYLIQRKINTWELINPPPEGTKTFIKAITLAPFTVEISAQVRLNELDAQSVVFFGTILNALGVVITNIEDAPIVFDGIELNDCVDTMQGINSKLMQHYKSSVMRQLYKIFGSLNIIGNPVSLFRNISTGFKDLKDKPSEGFVKGPLEFGKGLAEGTGSLIAHSVGGALNSVEKVTGTIASGLAALTFDKEFEQMREREKMKKPKHLFEGLEKGGKAVFNGFKEGITGVFLKPFESTKREGAIGFFKGTAQGLAGLVVKPVTGVIDFASKTTEGLKNTALYLEDKPNESRIRYPRVLYTETGMVREYDALDSKLQAIINKGGEEEKAEVSYFMERYRLSEKVFLVVTNQGIFSIEVDDEKIMWGLGIIELKYKRTQDNIVSIQGTPKDKSFWQKDLNESVTFEDKNQTDRFMKLIGNLKVSAGVF